MHRAFSIAAAACPAKLDISSRRRVEHPALDRGIEIERADFPPSRQQRDRENRAQREPDDRFGGAQVRVVQGVAGDEWFLSMTS
ncbi:MAG: hypothetical protein R2849_13770 [Thermomicrobiales bacterium]